MKIGFTGTRNGMTDEQKRCFAWLLLTYFHERPIEFHHGACKGSDAEAAALVRKIDPDARIVAHPGRSAIAGVHAENEWLDQESVGLADEVRWEKTHFARNRDIVDETEILVACPPCEPLPPSGGTAYTVGYAARNGKPVKIIWPDGIDRSK